MATYKQPTFQDRVGQSADAKKRALELLRNKPEADPAEVEARRLARIARETADRERRAAKKAEADKIKADKLAAAAAAAEAARVPVPEAPSLPTAAELKAARDARYAARKARR